MYLGLPSFSLRQKKRLQFGYIRDKVQRHIIGWNQREFSAGGKEVLIKAVAQSIPTYAMQCFRIPDSICDDINKICAGFWWGDKEEKRKLHWSKWDKLCRPKEFGGLGFRNLKAFNKALLAKQIWRMLTNPTSLVTRVFKARYFRNGDILTALVTPKASYVWRSIAGSRDLVDRGHRWKIGNGADVLVFGDNWVKGLHERKLEHRASSGPVDQRVSELISAAGNWDRNKLEGMFLPFETESITCTPIGEHGNVDQLCWGLEPKGNFTVKTAYLAEIGYYETDPHTSASDRKMWGKLVWSTSIPPKAKVMIWRALNNIIPTGANLQEHHVPIDGHCLSCLGRWGSTEHCLLYCPTVRMVWKTSRFWSVLKKGSSLSLLDIALAIHTEFDSWEYELWAIMLWQTWIMVCRKLHANGEMAEVVTELTCTALWDTYQQARATTSHDSALGFKLGERSWRRPRRGRSRVDVDALFNPTACCFGVGIIIRDHNGKILVASTKQTSPSTNALLAEIMVVINGIVTSIEHQIVPVEIFTDSCLAARTMADPNDYEQLLPDDVREIVEMARSSMLIGIFHMYRSANQAAHSLAQFAVHCSRETIWTENFPSWLEDIVSKDMNE